MNKHTPLTHVRGDQLRPAVRILRALAHPLRLNIIRVIHDNNGSANVGEIYLALDIEQSIASQHLRVLRQAELVLPAAIENSSTTVLTTNELPERQRRLPY